MTTIIILLITLLVASYITLPFFLRKKDPSETIEHSVSEVTPHEKLQALNNKRENLYSAIKDIDFDYGLGKLSKEDYEELNSKYRDEAAQVLKEIDSLEIESGVGDIDQDIEREILAFRGSNDDKLESEISSFRSSNTKDKKCSKCGADYSVGDTFCSKCGAKL